MGIRNRRTTQSGGTARRSNAIVNLCLLLASCAVGLSLCELSLRLFYPKYRALVDSPFRWDGLRIWARTPNARNWWPHPDTRSPHALHHNNFALRQHRNFSAADLGSAINVGVFGDSFVENVRMDAPYSFTEPLDYLLNQGPEKFNVLNFGVDGYGTDQSFLHYEHFRHAEDLDYVFYVLTLNDLGDIREARIFDLDDAGRLALNKAAQPSWWSRFVSRLHVSYLMEEAKWRLSSHTANVHSDQEIFEHLHSYKDRYRDFSSETRKALPVFRQLILRWRRSVERNGGGFLVVTLPGEPVDPSVVTLLREEDVKVISLHDCFRDHDDGHHWRKWRGSPYKFKRDPHWNESGNRLAAVCLYRFLEKEEMRLPGLSESSLGEALRQYYSAFGDTAPPGDARTAADIRRKYQALDEFGQEQEKQRLMNLVQAAEKRIISSEFDVHLDGKELIYAKEGCDRADVQGRFFLKVTSIDGKVFLEEMEFAFKAARLSTAELVTIGGGLGEGLCVAKKALPDYPIAHVWTGQIGGDGALDWQGEAFIDRDAFRKALEKATAPEKLAVRSEFDVYLDGQRITYVKDVCNPLDARRFFLHVTPVDEKDLPELDAENGYDNWDFDPEIFSFAQTGCMVRSWLPGYAIRRIRTGQFDRDEGVIWESEFSISHAADTEERRSGN